MKEQQNVYIMIMLILIVMHVFKTLFLLCKYKESVWISNK
jgi:hypothetical protein